MARYRVLGRRVLDRVNERDDEFRRVFFETLALLVADPYNDPASNAISVLPYAGGSKPNCYTVALGGHGLLLYQVKIDHPAIEFLDLIVFD